MVDLANKAHVGPLVVDKAKTMLEDLSVAEVEALKCGFGEIICGF